MDDQTAEVFASLGTSEALGLVIELLERPAGATVSDLENHCGLRQPTVTRLTQALARAGVLERDPKTRVYSLSAAEETRRLIDGATELALLALKARASTTQAVQRRVRKTRLKSAENSEQV